MNLCRSAWRARVSGSSRWRLLAVVLVGHVAARVRDVLEAHRRVFLREQAGRRRAVAEALGRVFVVGRLTQLGARLREALDRRRHAVVGEPADGHGRQSTVPSTGSQHQGLVGSAGERPDWARGWAAAVHEAGSQEPADEREVVLGAAGVRQASVRVDVDVVVLRARRVLRDVDVDALVAGVGGADRLARRRRALAPAAWCAEAGVGQDRGVVEGVPADRAQLDAPTAVAALVLDTEAGRGRRRNVEVACAPGPVHVPELRIDDGGRARCGHALLVGRLQLVGEQAARRIGLIAAGPRVDAWVQEGAAGRASAEVEGAVLARVHLRPRAAVVLAVAGCGRVVPDRWREKAGVGQARGGNDGLADRIARLT